jgi:uncharacterized repeat protein (TIGR04076 family)
METRRLIGKIVSVNGKCTAGHKVGEEFDLTVYSENGTAYRAPNICCFFYYELFPYITTMQFGGKLPWEKDRGIFRAGCPDNDKVAIEIKRVQTKLS